MSHQSKSPFAALCATLILLLVGTANATSDPMLTRHLTEAISKVQTGGSPSLARTQAAEHLAELTRGIDPNQVDDKALADLVSLLDTSDDSVRFWVASALGNLGPRAKIAIPKLLKLLPEADCLDGAITSAMSIRSALVKMGAPPPPPSTCHPIGR